MPTNEAGLRVTQAREALAAEYEQAGRFDMGRAYPSRPR
jgi:hypothetical protein